MELNPSANAAVSMSRFSIVFPYLFFLPAMEFLQDVECYILLLILSLIIFIMQLIVIG